MRRSTVPTATPLTRAQRHLTLARTALDAAAAEAPAYSTDALRFLRNELAETARRIDNLSKVLNTHT